MKKRPNPFLWLPLAGVLKISAFLQGGRLIRKTKIKRPSIILSNHGSFRDYVFVTAAVYPHRVNYLAAAKMFYEPERGPFLRMARAIPVCSFQGDVRAVANALQLLKKGAIVGIFPEGQISYDGASLNPPFSIAKFLKKANVPVYIVKNINTALMAPPWTTKIFKGKVFSEISPLFTPEYLSKLDEKMVYERLKAALYFDAGAFNKDARHKYQINDVSNLENLIFQCPNCQHEGLEVDFNKLICPACHHTLVYDEFGLLGNKTLRQHYDRQRRVVKQAIDQDENYYLSSPVRLVRYQDQTLKETGRGTLTLNRDYYEYQGSDSGQDVTYRYDTKTIEYLASDIGQNVQIYDQYEVFQFYMDDKKLPTKFTMAGEYFYQLKNDKKNKKA